MKWFLLIALVLIFTTYWQALLVCVGAAIVATTIYYSNTDKENVQDKLDDNHKAKGMM